MSKIKCEVNNQVTYMCNSTKEIAFLSKKSVGWKHLKQYICYLGDLRSLLVLTKSKFEVV